MNSKVLYQNYKKTEILTASPENILLMLYAGAIRYLKQASECHDKNEPERRNEWVGRTIDIVNELKSTLNHEIGGILAEHLANLYTYIGQKLVISTLENKKEPIEECLSLLQSLNEAWEKAVSDVKKERENTSPEK